MPQTRGQLHASKRPTRSTRKPKKRARTMRKRSLAANNVRDRGYYNDQGVFVPPVMTQAKMNEYLKEWYPKQKHVNRHNYTQEEMDEVKEWWTEQLYKPNQNQRNPQMFDDLKQRIAKSRETNPKPKQTFRSRKSRAKA